MIGTLGAGIIKDMDPMTITQSALDRLLDPLSPEAARSIVGLTIEPGTSRATVAISAVRVR
jgi:hypothetical protein